MRRWVCVQPFSIITPCRNSAVARPHIYNWTNYLNGVLWTAQLMALLVLWHNSPLGKSIFLYFLLSNYWLIGSKRQCSIWLSSFHRRHALRIIVIDISPGTTVSHLSILLLYPPIYPSILWYFLKYFFKKYTVWILINFNKIWTFVYLYTWNGIRLFCYKNMIR